MKYSVYPPIGIARIGNHSDAFFIGPETPDSGGTEVDSFGNEQSVKEYKSGDTGDHATSYRVKRQAARFRLYQTDPDSGVCSPAVLPEGAIIEWTVHLVNKKDAVKRETNPPSRPMPVTVVAGRENRIIDCGVQRVVAGQAPVVLSGTYIDQQVVLGQIQTDATGNLLVLAGRGISRSPENMPIGPDFYNNPGWYDDVGDGPVTATVLFADGTLEHAESAWIVSAPPDFAPAVRGVVTLYDRVLQSAFTAGLVPPKGRPSFSYDILPILERARGLRWVHDAAAWSIPMDSSVLSDVSAAASAGRKRAAQVVRSVPTTFTHPDYAFKLCDWQLKVLAEFENGDFEADFGTAFPLLASAPDVLTRSVLDGTVGEGFFPGIEAGIIVTDISKYSTPFQFRLDSSQLSSGDLTGLMAQPWQADFKKCATGWWPTQRPNKIPPVGGGRKDWARPSEGGNHQSWVQNAMRFGVITRRADISGVEVQEESRRDPALGP